MPIFKKGKKDNPRNYRLVGLTPVPWKMVEQVLWETITRQTEKKKCLGRASTDLSRKNSTWPTWLSSTMKWFALWMRGNLCMSFTLTSADFCQSPPQHSCSQTGEIQTEWVDYKVDEKMNGPSGLKGSGQWLEVFMSCMVQLMSGMIWRSIPRLILFNIIINSLDGGTECTFSKFMDDTRGSSWYTLSRRAAMQGDAIKLEELADMSLGSSKMANAVSGIWDGLVFCKSKGWGPPG